MKILFSVSYYHPYVSGLSLAAERWARGLVDRGHTLTVLTNKHDASGRSTEKRDGYTVIRARPLARIGKGFLSLDWIRQSWRCAQDYETVVAHLPQVEAVFPVLFAKLAGRRVVSVYHCEIALGSGFLNTVFQSVVEVSNFISLLLSDCIVTYTSDYAKHSKLLRLVQNVRPSVRIVTIIPPVPTPFVNRARQRSLRSRIGKADIVIGIAARLAKEKGVEYALEALGILCHKYPKKRIVLALAGPLAPVGEEEYRMRIESLVARYKERVIFLDTIPPQDMGSFYSLLNVLVLPSVNGTEAFGLVQVEAMLMGIPVISSDLPGVRIPVRMTGMGVIVPVGMSEALAQAMSDVSFHAKRYVKPFRNVRDLFSEDASNERFASLL